MNRKRSCFRLSVLLMIVSCIDGCAHPNTYSQEMYPDPGMMGPSSGGIDSSLESPPYVPQSIPHSTPQGSGTR